MWLSWEFHSSPSTFRRSVPLVLSARCKSGGRRDSKVMGLELFSENFGELSQGRMEDCSSSLCDHEGGGLATESAAASMLVYEASAAKCLLARTRLGLLHGSWERLEFRWCEGSKPRLLCCLLPEFQDPTPG